MLAEAIASGEWGEAADEIAGALGIDWTAAAAPGAAEAAALLRTARQKCRMETTERITE